MKTNKIAEQIGDIKSVQNAAEPIQKVVRDIIPAKIEALRRGDVPIYEPGLDQLLANHSERLSFTTDVSEATLPAWS